MDDGVFRPTVKPKTPKRKPRKPGTKPRMKREPGIVSLKPRIDIRRSELEAAKAVAAEMAMPAARLFGQVIAGIAKKKDGPIIDPATLPKTAQQKLDTAIRQSRKQAELELEVRRQQIDEEVRLRVVKEGAKYREEMRAMRDKAQAAENTFRNAIANHKFILTPDQFTSILRCLHPDSRNTVTADRLATAFRIFNSEKLRLTGEK